MKPRLGWGARPALKGRLLFVCYYDPNFIATVVENIGMWQRLSEYELVVLNLWPNRKPYLTLPESLRLDEFEGVVVHSTASYFFANLKSLDSQLPCTFAEYEGVKVLMKQDEQVMPGRVARYLGEQGFDLLVTCVPEPEIRKVYPRNIVGELEFLHAYTGYISPAQIKLWDQYKGASRHIDVGYRGSIQPLQFGRLGYEKRQIGYAAQAAKRPDSLVLDISSREEDRIGGTGWFDFLGAAKAALGVESGSNLFDFEGEVEEWCAEFARREAGRDPASEEYYLQAHREHLHRYEDNVAYAQISPRHLEAACAGTAQILYEGEYSGLFKAGEHYFSLKRDFSNWDEALDLVRDERARGVMVERAYEEIVCCENLQYQAFVRSFDRAIDRIITRKQPTRSIGRPTFGKASRPRVLIMVPHDPVQDPRVDWWARTLASTADVCELGTYHTSLIGDGPSYTRLSGNRIQVRVERSLHDWSWPMVDNLANPDPGTAVLSSLSALQRMPKKAQMRAVGAVGADANQLARFTAMCQYFVDTNSALLQAGETLGAFDLIVCSDIDVLPASVALAQKYNSRLLYDAHEYWPYAFPQFEAWECQFWAGLEASLAPFADRRVTVSPQLADIMGGEYGVRFETVPNCAPLADGDVVDVSDKTDLLPLKSEIDFLFQGGFAEGRGLKHLIQAWVNVKSPARLLLRGLDGPYKDSCIALARELGLLNKVVFFPAPVPENELVLAAAEADVGIVPYEPLNVNNRNSSPNKLSQYMAAGLPILSNSLNFVGAVVTRSGSGRVVDFSDHKLLASTVDAMVSDRQLLVVQSQAAHTFFKREFHFEAAAAETLDWVKQGFENRRDVRRERIDLSWVDGSDFFRAPAETQARCATSASLSPQIVTPVGTAPENAGRVALRFIEYPVVRGIGRSVLGVLPGKLRGGIKSRILGLVRAGD